ncbi:MAG: polysaccharide biosynthesis/export family protein [Planctomycetia bacterium]
MQRLTISMRTVLRCAIAVSAFVTLPGCHGRVIRATRLPSRYQAAVVTNAKIADLSRLSIPTTSSSIIEPEDVVDVAIASGLEDAARVAPIAVRVDDEGVANIALVGPVPLAGMEPFAAEQLIAETAVERGLYRQPQVTVTMRKKAVNRVTIIGAVEKQGVQELPRGQSTLLAALVAAGSLNERAGTTIEVRRHEAAMPAMARTKEAPSGSVQVASAETPAGSDGLMPVPEQDDEHESVPAEPRVMKIDLARIDASGSNDVQLKDGDIIRVETRDPNPISVIGLVRKPGQYEMPVNQPMHVLDALALAGERSNSWADKVIITRHVRGRREPVVIQTSVMQCQHDDTANIRLSPGDVVSVEQTPATVVNTVLGNIIRFSFVAGGRVAVF